MSHVHVTPAAGAAYFSQADAGPIHMLNLLRFRETADFSDSPELDPGSPISGQEAYQLYMQAVKPLLQKAGSELVFSGKCHAFLIGPTTETWDLMLLVRHPGKQAFMAFASDPDYQKIAGYRTAALADSRLLPVG